MMKGIKSGDATVRMFISKPIPDFCLLPKARSSNSIQRPACEMCTMLPRIRGCRGNGNVAKCEKAEDNGKAVPLAEYWKIITVEAEEQRAQKRDGEETSEIPGTSLS